MKKEYRIRKKIYDDGTIKYLSEVKSSKSFIKRAIQHDNEERNYHIFYQMCSSPTMNLMKPENYNILNYGHTKVSGIDDRYDFDQTITPEKCLDNVLKNVVNGSIIVFHDNVKAEQNLKYALPKTLAFLKEKGFVCTKID